MKHGVFLAAILSVGSVSAASSLGCSSGAGGPGDATFPADALATLASESGGLTIEVRTAPEQPPSRGVISVEYRVTDTAGMTRDGLQVSVVPWMPDMGHGASTTPVVTPEGGGRYLIEDVELFMPGRWELRTTLGGLHDGGDPKTPADDRATASFDIP